MRFCSPGCDLAHWVSFRNQSRSLGDFRTGQAATKTFCTQGFCHLISSQISTFFFCPLPWEVVTLWSVLPTVLLETTPGPGSLTDKEAMRVYTNIGIPSPPSPVPAFQPPGTAGAGQRPAVHHGGGVAKVCRHGAVPSGRRGPGAVQHHRRCVRGVRHGCMHMHPWDVSHVSQSCLAFFILSSTPSHPCKWFQPPSSVT